jgi:hypothetical protein
VNFIKRLKKYMHAHSTFLIVEYDTDESVKKWVPYPVSFQSLKALFEKCGYTSVTKINEQKSIYGEANIYSAIIQQ